MWNTERLMQIQVTHVSTDRTWRCKTNLCIHVRAVHVDTSAMLVHNGADVLDRFFEHAVCRRIGHHQRRKVSRVRFCLCREICNIYVSVRIALNDNDLHASHHS